MVVYTLIIYLVTPRIRWVQRHDKNLQVVYMLTIMYVDFCDEHSDKATLA